MTKEEIKSEILHIQTTLGISNSKMGELCGISGPTYAKCKSNKAEGHSFNSGNLERLKKSLREIVDVISPN